MLFDLSSASGLGISSTLRAPSLQGHDRFTQTGLFSVFSPDYQIPLLIQGARYSAMESKRHLEYELMLYF